MAITDTFPAAEAEILVNEVALQEYFDDEDASTSDRTVVRYIEAVSGADFTIRYKIDSKPKFDVTVDIYLDDKWVAGRVVERSLFRISSYQQTVVGVNSNSTGNWSLSKFSFADLKVGM